MKRILLIRTDRIGDTVLTLPAATALKAAFPEVQISFLARNYTEPLVRLYQDVDEVLVYEP
ncbi:MAG TPA: ADP-heptose--LPS heptosyltransferase, partial [Deltaproteobacteria bacterium]|nr:ADP-heptose--LPS heptosyltransferase [Deltaproteobacteria bacterium]